MTQNISFAPQARAAHRFACSERGMFAGVCGGAAEHYGIDETLLRVAFVAATILGFGSGIVVYLAAWFLAPQD